MGKLKSLWTKEKTGSEITTAERRLQRYLDADAERLAKEKLQLISAMKALKAARKERANDLKAANTEAVKTANGVDVSNKVVPDWRAEAERRLAVTENTWPHKLGANLQRWRGNKPNSISSHSRKT